MTEDILLLVNESDQVTGYGEKMEVHAKALLHRAFSVFIYNIEEGTILLQKRAQGKYHSGGLWTNSCCSHPRKGESMEESVRSRLEKELGIRMPLPFREKAEVSSLCEVGSFRYLAPFEGLSEHEIDHVFLCALTAEETDLLKTELKPDPEEVSELAWIRISDIDRRLKERPEEFTAWFPQAYTYVRETLMNAEALQMHT